MITRPSLALSIALCTLFGTGCATSGSKPSASGTGPSKPDASAAAPRTVPGPVQVLGRVIAVDMRTLSVIIDLAPYVSLPGDFATRQLISRRDDHQPTARLQSSPYLRGRTLGARLLAGQPQVGDEVVFLPVTP